MPTPRPDARATRAAVLKELEAHRQDQYVSCVRHRVDSRRPGRKERRRGAVQRAFEDHAVEFGIARTSIAPFKTIASEPAIPGRDAARWGSDAEPSPSAPSWLAPVHAGRRIAQQDQGMIAGRVTDPSGAMVSAPSPSRPRPTPA